MAPENNANTGYSSYKMSQGMIIAGIVFVGILALGLLAGAYLIYISGKEPVVKYWLAGGAAALACLCIWYAAHLYKIGKSLIEITPSGITRKEMTGESVSFNWSEIAKLNERGFMQQLAMADNGGMKKLPIDYQFNDYEAIRKRVFEEVEKRMNFTYPAVFGKVQITMEKAYVILFTLIVFGFGLGYYFDTKHDPLILVVGGCFFLPFLVMYLVSQLITVKQVLVDSEGLKLKKLTGTLTCPFLEVADLEYKYISQRYNYSVESAIIEASGGGRKQPVIEITLANNKRIKIKNSPGSLPEIYLAIKKACDKAGVKPLSQEVLKNIKASDLL